MISQNRCSLFFLSSALVAIALVLAHLSSLSFRPTARTCAVRWTCSKCSPFASAEHDTRSVVVGAGCHPPKCMDPLFIAHTTTRHTTPLYNVVACGVGLGRLRVVEGLCGEGGVVSCEFIYTRTSRTRLHRGGGQDKGPRSPRRRHGRAREKKVRRRKEGRKRLNPSLLARRRRSWQWRGLGRALPLRVRARDGLPRVGHDVVVLRVRVCTSEPKKNEGRENHVL